MARMQTRNSQHSRAQEEIATANSTSTKTGKLVTKTSTPARSSIKGMVGRCVSPDTVLLNNQQPAVAAASKKRKVLESSSSSTEDGDAYTRTKRRRILTVKAQNLNTEADARREKNDARREKDEEAAVSMLLVLSTQHLLDLEAEVMEVIVGANLVKDIIDMMKAANLLAHFSSSMQSPAEVV
jgi:hypothetical protein